MGLACMSELVLLEGPVGFVTTDVNGLVKTVVRDVMLVVSATELGKG
jgi:hypothetical protein